MIDEEREWYSYQLLHLCIMCDGLTEKLNDFLSEEEVHKIKSDLTEKYIQRATIEGYYKENNMDKEIWRVWDWNGNDCFYSSEYLARNKCINLIVDTFPNPQTPEEFEEREKCFEELEEYQGVIDICGYEKVGDEEEDE